jgi:hypothetical protein|tara:strand:+ start:1196 stop:1525 length:330 start_codon:yes stop_codon:yes gene_type:complete
MPKTIFVDIDGTICTDTGGKYEEAKPMVERIEFFNKLFDEGNTITYWTARGMNSGTNHRKLTKSQLIKWGAKHTKLIMKKPSYDIFIDDKTFNADEFFAGTYFSEAPKN